MELNGKDINDAMQENEALRKSVLEGLTANGYVVKPKDEYENTLKEYEEKTASRVTKEQAERIENDLKELGYEKKDGQKYHEVYKEAIKGLQTKAQKADELEKKIAEYKEKRDGNDISKKEADEWKSRAKELEEMLKETETKYTTELTTFKKKANVEKGLSGVKFRKDIPDSLIELAKEKAVNTVIGLPTEERDGQIVFLDQEGHAKRNKDNGNSYLTTKDILSDLLKEVVDTTEKRKGVDTKSILTKGEDGKETVNAAAIPEGEVKTKVELTEWLKKKGYAIGTKEYNKIYDELSANLPLR